MFGFILLFLALSLYPFSSPWVCHFSFVSLTLIFVLSPVSDSIHHLCCGLPVKVTGTGWKDEENKRAERWPHGVKERPGISPLSPPPPPLSSSLQLHMHTLSASLFLPYPCQYFSLSLPLEFFDAPEGKGDSCQTLSQQWPMNKVLKESVGAFQVSRVNE